MPSKIQLYREIVSKYEDTYGNLPDTGDKPILINITGPLRKKLYENDHLYDNDVLYMVISAIIFAVLFAPNLMTIILIMSMSICFMCSETSMDYSNIFDGEYIDIDGYMIGVVIPTQEEEGELETRNFDETNDGRKLREALLRAGLDGDAKVAVASVGSTTTQFIYGQENINTNEIEVGVDHPLDNEIIELLDAVDLDENGILVIMNSAGYAVRADAGVLYNDNQSKTDTITPEIVDRVVGGSGDNSNAQKFAHKLIKVHKEIKGHKKGKRKYTLVLIPRGDPDMPQGGSHTHQRMLEAARHGFNITVIEVSGKQTKIFELMDGNVKDYSAESICGRIKNKKVLTKEGKTYGSGVVFGGFKL
jgi:hypothetical protein